jgi:hypothetical protein
VAHGRHEQSANASMREKFFDSATRRGSALSDGSVRALVSRPADEPSRSTVSIGGRRATCVKEEHGAGTREALRARFDAVETTVRQDASVQVPHGCRQRSRYVWPALRGAPSSERERSCKNRDPQNCVQRHQSTPSPQRNRLRTESTRPRTPPAGTYLELIGKSERRMNPRAAPQVRHRQLRRR